MQISNNKNTEGVEMITSDVLTSQFMASIYKSGDLSSSKTTPLSAATVNSLVRERGFLGVDQQKLYTSGRKPSFSGQRCPFCNGKNLLTWLEQLMT